MTDAMNLAYYDTCLYDPTVLSALVKIVGADHLLLGSDWPIGEADPPGFVDRCTGLNETDRRMIKGGRTAALIGVHWIKSSLLIYLGH